MYYVAYARDNLSTMTVGVAAASEDSLYSGWRNLCRLYSTGNRDHTYSGIIESPHVFYDHGRWWLFYTTDANQPLGRR
jgi:hypothetical protein